MYLTEVNINLAQQMPGSFVTELTEISMFRGSS